MEPTGVPISELIPTATLAPGDVIPLYRPTGTTPLAKNVSITAELLLNLAAARTLPVATAQAAASDGQLLLVGGKAPARFDRLTNRRAAEDTNLSADDVLVPVAGPSGYAGADAYTVPVGQDGPYAPVAYDLATDTVSVRPGGTSYDDAAIQAQVDEVETDLTTLETDVMAIDERVEVLEAAPDGIPLAGSTVAAPIAGPLVMTDVPGGTLTEVEAYDGLTVRFREEDGTLRPGGYRFAEPAFVLAAGVEIELTSPDGQAIVGLSVSNAGQLLANDAPVGGGGGGASTLDGLTDVTVATPANGQVLSYNGSQWVNAPAGGGPSPTGQNRKFIRSNGTTATYEVPSSNDVKGAPGYYPTLAAAQNSSELPVRQRDQRVYIHSDPTALNNGAYIVATDGVTLVKQSANDTEVVASFPTYDPAELTKSPNTRKYDNGQGGGFQLYESTLTTEATQPVPLSAGGVVGAGWLALSPAQVTAQYWGGLKKSSTDTQTIAQALDAVRSTLAPQAAQKTASYTLAAADAGYVADVNSASAVTVTVPAGLPLGSVYTFFQRGAGQIVFAGSGGMVRRNLYGYTKTAGTHASCTVHILTATEFVLTGELAA